jgi:hypothetical protein
MYEDPYHQLDDLERVDQARELFDQLTPTERQLVVDGYCRGCWGEAPCQCDNDE